ncbi:MAG: hypothetical protein HC876_22420 [Chloroflexaceae bacterium]|nr:hypothetical protein [Chloroflexaceae bacterium]
MASQLFGLAPHDPASMAAAIAIVVLVALLAAITGYDPFVARRGRGGCWWQVWRC